MEFSRPERDVLPDKLEIAIDKSIRYFYFEVLGGNIPPYKEVVNKFEKLWLKDKDITKIIGDRDTPGKNIHFYTTEGMRIIHEFYKKNYKKPGQVIILGERYSVPIDIEARIEGKFDIVLKDSENNIILPKYTMRGKPAFAQGSLNNFKMITDAMAYRHRTETLENKHKIVYIKSGYKIEDKVVTDLNIRQTKDIITEMKTCKTYYPTHGNYWCKHCKMEQYCEGW